GRGDLAEECFSAAVSELSLRYPLSHCGEAARVVGSMARTGRFGTAVGLTSTMCDDHRYRELMFETLGMLVQMLCKAGEYEKASMLLMAITDPSAAAQTLCAVAEIATEAGHHDHADRAASLALRLSSRTPDSDRHEVVLARLACLKARRGDLRQALRDLEPIT